MDHRVGEYLVTTFSSSYTIAEDTAEAAAEDTTKWDARHALFIAESRPSFWLPRVIRNFRAHHPTWPLYLVGSPEVFRLVLGRCGIDGVIPLPFAPPGTPHDFSQLMMSSAFWNAIAHDKLLVFQQDAVCLRPVPTDALETYAMVGAACGHVTLPGEPAAAAAADDTFTVQGGLSYRDVHAMRRAVHALRVEDRQLAEDVAITRVLRRLGERLPDLPACLNFAIEAFGNPLTAVGMHGVDKMYVPAALIAAALPPVPHIPLYDCCVARGPDPGALLLRVALLRRVVTHFYIGGDVAAAVMARAETMTPHITWVRDDDPVDRCGRVHRDAGALMLGDLADLPDPAVLLDSLPNLRSPVRLGHRTVLRPVAAGADEPVTAVLADAVCDYSARWITALRAALLGPENNDVEP